MMPWQNGGGQSRLFPHQSSNEVMLDGHSDGDSSRGSRRGDYSAITDNDPIHLAKPLSQLGLFPSLAIRLPFRLRTACLGLEADRITQLRRVSGLHILLRDAL